MAYDRATVVTTAILQAISTSSSATRWAVETLLRDEFSEIERQLVSDLTSGSEG